MPYDKIKAVQIATTQGNRLRLGGMMCWQAVATILTEAGAKGIAGAGNGFGRELLDVMYVGDVDASNAATVPAGEVIAFYQGDVIQHMMISTGNGYAMGTKNGILGDMFSQAVWMSIHLPTAWGAWGGRNISVRYGTLAL